MHIDHQTTYTRTQHHLHAHDTLTAFPHKDNILHFLLFLGLKITTLLYRFTFTRIKSIYDRALHAYTNGIKSSSPLACLLTLTFCCCFLFFSRGLISIVHFDTYFCSFLDLDLWHQYVEFCKSCKQFHVVAQIYSRLVSHTQFDTLLLCYTYMFAHLMFCCSY